MAVIAPFKEYVKELYHDGARSVKNFLAPIAFTGILAFTACGPSTPPTPAPTATPNPITADLVCYSGGEGGRPRPISLNYQSPVQCLKSGKLVLRFEADAQVRIGDTLNIPVFVSGEVSSNSPVNVNYSKQGWRQEPGTYGEFYNIQMLTLATIPPDREVILKFKPESSGSYNFFIPGVNFLKPEVRWPKSNASSPWVSENKGVIGRVCVGSPANVSLKSDVRESTPYNSVLITASGNDIQSIVIKGENNYRKEFSAEDTPQYLVNWIPEKSGTYTATATGHDGCFKSVSDTLTIVVK